MHVKKRNERENPQKLNQQKVSICMGNSDWLSCWPSRGQQVLHHRRISGNIHHIHLHQDGIRLPTLALKPRADITKTKSKYKTGISVAPCFYQFFYQFFLPIFFTNFLKTNCSLNLHRAVRPGGFSPWGHWSEPEPSLSCLCFCERFSLLVRHCLKKTN